MSAELLANMSLESDEQSQLTKFPFLQLPVDIRQYFYALVLPGQSFPMNTGRWAEVCDIPSDFIAILRANKQISDEALQALYGGISSTVIITGEEMRSLKFYQDAKSFRPFVPMGNLQYMRNWQLALRFDAEYDSDLMPCSRLAPHHDSQLATEQYYIREGVLSTTVVLAGVSDLQTLKLSFPCLCKKTHDTSVDRVTEAITFAMEPLQRLRFHGNVTFIAATPIAEPSKYFEKVKLAPTPAANTQCQQPACLAFASSFDEIKSKLQDNTPRTTLTARQTQWLDVKHYAADTAPSTHRVRFALAGVWCAMENKTDEEFAQTISMARWVIDDTFKEIFGYLNGDDEADEIDMLRGPFPWS
ncbi:MAG: hypothetical protein LQ343_007935 [Gyalolechia ehrenbergii]|nr:MAG: hypothetical protein LQ343_007935 [Gyalolechia ehrenbergii]